MGRRKSIPDDVRAQVKVIVNQFNEEHSTLPQANPISQLLSQLRRTPADQQKPRYRIGEYVPRFRGKFLYLDRVGFDQRPTQICRLTWDGDMDNWKFAIYKYSNEAYDPEEWFFPGAGEVDGTVTGAMRAGNKAYTL